MATRAMVREKAIRLKDVLHRLALRSIVSLKRRELTIDAAAFDDEDDEDDEGAAVAGKTKHTVQEVVTRFKDRYLSSVQLIYAQVILLTSIVACKTAALGGKVEQCPACGLKRVTFNACHNRCCPNCQAMQRLKWVEERLARMLPIGHFHVVFTLPAQLRDLAFRNKRRIPYGILMKAAAETLQSLAAERMKARLGITVIVHTWSRAMITHPHVHVIVTSGGLSFDGSTWVPCAPDLFPREELLGRFREIFMSKLAHLAVIGQLDTDGVAGWSTPEEADATTSLLQGMAWVGHVREPFTGVEALTKYLGQYTNRMVIADSRILDVDDNTVTIATKNGKTLTLAGEEFIRRFLLHIPPARACRVRHYGLYCSFFANTLLETARQLVSPGAAKPVSHQRETWEQRLLRVTGVDPLICPACGKGRMQLVEELREQWSVSTS
jgi:hypothetical protein